MSAVAPPADQRQRLEALDTKRSFIVQAPAGSGKTGLLTQRYLALLSRVEHPEEIVAITFTRKAAAEMQARILDALRAADGPAPGQAFEILTWQMARAALQHSRQQGWDVLENPQRLRIRTIDSLCQFISRQLPVQSGFGDVPGVAEEASFLYQAAASQVLQEVESKIPLADSLATLLRALDNEPDKLAGLIAAMLAKRDQWLRHIVNHGSRAEIERALLNAIERHLAELQAAFSSRHTDELLRLARFAAGNLNTDHPLAVLRDRAVLPGSGIEDLDAWLAIAELLLVKNGGWRATVNKNLGFPADKDSHNKAMKDHMLALLGDLHGEDSFRALLAGSRDLPNPVFNDEEWQLIEALFGVLRDSAGMLKLVFAEHGLVDFTELSLSAQLALGTELEPTDLALSLDYRLQHLLVDEFQDTSQNQFELFKRLTAGWQPGDGRTLFLVGDPMQSIYGFREAEVGLFLEAWQGRLGGVVLEPLRLSVNFRSDRGIIDWVNEVFPQVFPATDNREKGAVSYATSDAVKPAELQTAATVHPYLGRDDAAEAAQVLELVCSARERGGETAILARGRAHLAEIVTQLRAAGERFQAVEIGQLKHRPVVMDLVSLTNALLHLGDRVSWLALLSGPYCGLSLADLLVLTGEDSGDHDRAVVDLLFDDSRLAMMSGDGQSKLARLARLITTVMAERGRRPLSQWVEGAWLALGGPLTLVDAAAEEDVEVYFELLQRLQADAQPVTPERVIEEVDRLCALPDPESDKSLQLMTIHKAKGLEFDTVIVPGLGKGPRRNDQSLLYWLEIAGESGRPELLFGPVRNRKDGEDSSISGYIKTLQSEMSDYEEGRLLYVATTRARRELHLLGHANLSKSGVVKPRSSSLLALLWPAVRDAWDGLETPAVSGSVNRPGPFKVERSSVPASWMLPAAPAGVLGQVCRTDYGDNEIPFEWAGETARAVGTVVHRLLQHCVQTGSQGQGSREVGCETVERLLRTEGVTTSEIDMAMERVGRAVDNAIRDPRGQWVLSGAHAESQCELPLTAVIDGRVRHLVIDRTFVDEDGTRWIIDYKTGVHAGGSIETFLDHEAERYGEQLAHYTAAFRKLEDRTVRAALYFPLIEGGWRELEV